MTPIGNLQLHIDYQENATLKGVNYFETLQGKIELEFFSKVADFYKRMIN
jgi:hypothetical protein